MWVVREWDGVRYRCVCGEVVGWGEVRIKLVHSAFSNVWATPRIR